MQKLADTPIDPQDARERELAQAYDRAWDAASRGGFARWSAEQEGRDPLKEALLAREAYWAHVDARGRGRRAA